MNDTILTRLLIDLKKKKTHVHTNFRSNRVMDPTLHIYNLQAYDYRRNFFFLKTRVLPSLLEMILCSVHLENFKENTQKSFLYVFHPEIFNALLFVHLKFVMCSPSYVRSR